MTKTVEVMQLIQLLERCEELGADRAGLCAAAGIAPPQLADPDRRAPFDAFLRAITAAAQQTGDPLIGLRAGLVRRPRGLLIYQFRAQDTLKDALARLAQNVRLAADPLVVEVREGTREAWIGFGVHEPDGDAVELASEYMAGFLIGFLAEAVPSLRPDQIRFPHAPRASVAAYEALLRAPVWFRSSGCAIGITPDWLSAPLPAANAAVARMLDEQIERRLDLQRAGAFRAEVERVMEELLRERRPLVRPGVARRVGLSVRTLQRRLTAEAFTFRAVRESVLQRVGAALLARPSLPLDEVAQRLGFAEEDAFAKAWKRWTGRTPREQRRNA